MDENENPPALESRPHHLHETTDANPLMISSFGVGLAILIAAVFPLVSWMFWRFESAARRTDEPGSAAIVTPTFAGPHLQSLPKADLLAFRKEEDHRLASYGWIDPDRHAVRIPIERAISLLAERGFPEPKQAVKPVLKQEINQ